MKKLYIVRHAKSSWDFPELEDIERPLNSRGKKNAPEMGKRLADRNVKPDMIISSPAKRAFSTARKIAQEISYPKNRILKDKKIYHGSKEMMLDVIHAVPPEINILMLFGHNPGLTDLVNYLTKSDIYNIPTCGVAEIDFKIDLWKDVGKDKGKLVDFDYPKKS